MKLKYDKNRLIKEFILSLTLTLGFIVLEKITGGQHFNLVAAISILILATVISYFASFRPKVLYFKSLFVGFVSVIILFLLWIILGFIIYLIFGVDISELYIDLENIRLIFMN